MSRNAWADQPCECGHPRQAHQHYRSGGECSLCQGCERFRAHLGLARIIGAVFRRRH